MIVGETENAMVMREGERERERERVTERERERERERENDTENIDTGNSIRRPQLGKRMTKITRSATPERSTGKL